MISDRIKLGILKTVREIGDKFTEPDDDWVPVAILIKDGHPAPVLIPMKNEREKEISATLFLPLLIKETKPDAYALVVSAWMAQYKAVENESTEVMQERLSREEVPPAEHPDRKEMVFVSFGAKDGSLEVWSAEISRYDSAPPDLGEWEIFSRGTEVLGRFVEPLQAAITSNDS